MDDLVVRPDAPTRVPQRTGAEGCVLDVVVEYGRGRNALVTDAGQLAIVIGPDRNRLNACGLVANHRIQLGARKLDAHGSVQDLRGKSRQQRMRPDVTFAAEAPTQKLTHNIDFLWWYAKHYRH